MHFACTFKMVAVLMTSRKGLLGLKLAADDCSRFGREGRHAKAGLSFTSLQHRLIKLEQCARPFDLSTGKWIPAGRFQLPGIAALQIPRRLDK